MSKDQTIFEPCSSLEWDDEKQQWVCEVECNANNSYQRCYPPSIICQKVNNTIVEVTNCIGNFKNAKKYWHPNQKSDAELNKK